MRGARGMLAHIGKSHKVDMHQGRKLDSINLLEYTTIRQVLDDELNDIIDGSLKLEEIPCHLDVPKPAPVTTSPEQSAEPPTSMPSKIIKLPTRLPSRFLQSFLPSSRGKHMVQRDSHWRMVKTRTKQMSHLTISCRIPPSCVAQTECGLS